MNFKQPSVQLAYNRMPAAEICQSVKFIEYQNLWGPGQQRALDYKFKGQQKKARAVLCTCSCVSCRAQASKKENTSLFQRYLGILVSF